MKFQTLTALGTIRAKRLLRHPNVWVIKRNVGIRPPEKNIVISRYTVKTLRPINRFFESGYAIMDVKSVLSAVPVTVTITDIRNARGKVGAANKNL